MSGPTPLSVMSCRKCGRLNPWAYFAPVIDPYLPIGTCICLSCAEARGWLDRDGNLKPGITL
ncbi:hypothetical protein [Paracoccus tegillarcae]|uniref:Uncharacterized protein n=2 Tax=Paracoccus tegillarcae TaxID=1529068 RepID=A0A2K9EMS1_9RHOB|nr:hypothetical protein [Paracoccus tegillarcae]AUH35729.1 hypothetical protein CUV01_19290 [Paracoccus tegillarcae]